MARNCQDGDVLDDFFCSAPSQTKDVGVRGSRLSPCLRRDATLARLLWLLLSTGR